MVKAIPGPCWMQLSNFNRLDPCNSQGGNIHELKVRGRPSSNKGALPLPSPVNMSPTSFVQGPLLIAFWMSDSFAWTE